MGHQSNLSHRRSLREKLLTRPSTLSSDDLSRLDFLPFFVCGRRGGGGGNSINLFTPKRTVLALPPNSLANRPISSSAPVPRFSYSPTKVSFSNSHFLKTKSFGSCRNSHVFHTFSPKGRENFFNRAPKGDTVFFCRNSICDTWNASVKVRLARSEVA